MEHIFSQDQQLAIANKTKFLNKLLVENTTLLDLNLIRVNKKRAWMEKFGSALIAKYQNLPPEEQAYRIIYFEDLKLDQNDVPMQRLSSTKIRIESRNFCPYLEACLGLGLETRTICKKTGEASFQVVAEMVNPNLKFSRNYNNIRPHAKYCEEFIELIR
jgi:hypothetical protein